MDDDDRSCPLCESKCYLPPLFFSHYDVAQSEALAVPWTRCQECGTFYMTQVPDTEAVTRHLRMVAYGQQSKFQQIGNQKNKLHLEVLDAIFHVNPYADTVLDYGCSFGVFMKMAKDRGLCTYGIDVNHEAIDYMRDLGYQALLGNQIGAAKEFGILFSAIVMNDVLYYVNEPIRAMTTSFDLLKPGGVFVLRVSNKASWMSLTLRIPGIRRSVIKAGCLDHFHVADVRQYCRVLKKIGFSKIRVIGSAFSADFSKMSFSSLAAYRVGTLVRKLSFGKWVLDPGVLITAAKSS